MIHTFGWCRVEGAHIPNPGSLYGTYLNLPASTTIFYGAPEIQIYNPDDTVDGIVYRVVPISALDGNFSTIIDIDSNWPSIQTAINNYDRTIDTNNGSVYWYEPFVVTEPSVIFYAASSEDSYKKYEVIFVDSYATPKIIAITAKYKGEPIPVGDSYDILDLQVYAVYEDGQKSLIRQAFTVTPADQIITVVGSNPVVVGYDTAEGKHLQATCIIEGIKKLIGIEATYDGPVVPVTKAAERKYFIVRAMYSDGSSATVTGYSFPNGNIVSETNGGILQIYYKGFYTDVIVPTYSVSSSRLIAYYNGPNVEVGDKWLKQYAKIKIYYHGDTPIHSYYEDIDPDNCIFTPETIDHEGLNQILVQYTGKAGPVSTMMVVVGIKPEVKLNFIDAEYTGPDIVVGQTFSPERVIVKAHYSDGTVIQIKNFSISSNVVNYVGPLANAYTIRYIELDQSAECLVYVNGLERDATTENNYKPISLDKNYPEMTRYNNRYRGPAEAHKMHRINQFLYDAINDVYDIFKNIEKNYNEIVTMIAEDAAVKYETLNTVVEIETSCNKWMEDKRFTTGEYVMEEE